MPRLYFWRDKLGHEIDCLAISGTEQIPMEIKAGKTVSNDYFDGLTYWYDLFNTAHNGIVFLCPAMKLNSVLQANLLVGHQYNRLMENNRNRLLPIMRIFSVHCILDL